MFEQVIEDFVSARNYKVHNERLAAGYRLRRTARVTVPAWACSYPSIRRMGAERVAVDFECPGLVFADGSAERVDGWTDLNIDETGLLEHRSPSRTSVCRSGRTTACARIVGPDVVAALTDVVGDHP